MKHPGCCLDFTSQRNEELMRAFRVAIAERPFVDITEISEIVVNTPCSRFWVSEFRAAIVISDMFKGRPVLETMRPLKREMFTEIYKRACALKEEHPDWPICDLAFAAVNSPAPKFYLLPRSAIEYIYKIKRGHFNK